VEGLSKAMLADKAHITANTKQVNLAVLRAISRFLSTPESPKASFQPTNKPAGTARNKSGTGKPMNIPNTPTE
jgi:hypothetical protein